MQFENQEYQVRRWIEQGRQVGKSFEVDRDHRRFRCSVAIQKQQGRYKVHVYESDQTKAWDDDPRDDFYTFSTLDEAIAFIESTTPAKLKELATRKGQKWFG